jgi:hypothetical protein
VWYVYVSSLAAVSFLYRHLGADRVNACWKSMWCGASTSSLQVVGAEEIVPVSKGKLVKLIPSRVGDFGSLKHGSSVVWWFHGDGASCWLCSLFFCEDVSS